MVQSARPLATSHSSLPSNGRIGTRCRRTVSGERKEDILQVSCGFARLRPELRERAHAADAAVGEQHEAVTDARCVAQLVNSEYERSPGARELAQHVHDVARLPKVETVEWLVHQ